MHSQAFNYTEEELEQDLSKLFQMGFPTFDEFKKNPDKYRTRHDSVFESAQNSFQDPLRRRNLKNQKYYWRYAKENMPLEKIQRLCAEEGFSWDQVEQLPIPHKTTAGKEEVIVRFFPKGELMKMGVIIPNG